jgi:hypothetical protein
MRVNRCVPVVLGVTLLAITAAAAPVKGPPQFDLSWNTIDGGGGTSTGGSFALSGTIGQPDAGTMSGGIFSLQGGFWAAGGEPGFITCLGDFVSSATFQPPPDGQVDAADLAFLLGEWGANPGSPADMVTSATFQPPPDGVVDAADLAVLLGAWGACE